jgi:prevent-host-death family protein
VAERTRLDRQDWGWWLDPGAAKRGNHHSEEDRRQHRPSAKKQERLRGLRQPQYRLRVGEIRILHDVTGTTVQVLAIVTKLEADSWLAQFAKSGVKKVPLSEINDDLSRYLREAETQEIVITRHGKPAGVLIGFESEEDWFEYRLENDPRFLRRIEQARNSLHVGRGLRQEDVETE